MYETLFAAVNAAVLPAWALLLLAPGWRWTQRVAVTVTVGLLSIVYAGMFALAAFGGQGDEGVDFTTMAGVAAIFDAPAGIVIGWTHYLAFDLFVGAWIVRDARRSGVSFAWRAPAVVLCFLAGPAGYLLYWIVRPFAVRKTRSAQF